MAVASFNRRVGSYTLMKNVKTVIVIVFNAEADILVSASFISYLAGASFPSIVFMITVIPTRRPYKISKLKFMM